MKLKLEPVLINSTFYLSAIKYSALSSYPKLQVCRSCGGGESHISRWGCDRRISNFDQINQSTKLSLKLADPSTKSLRRPMLQHGGRRQVGSIRRLNNKGQQGVED
jgi:hypothetical protein